MYTSVTTADKGAEDSKAAAAGVVSPRAFTVALRGPR